MAKKFLELEQGLKFPDNCQSYSYKVFGVFYKLMDDLHTSFYQDIAIIIKESFLRISV